MRQLDATLAREVAVELELLLQLQGLVARVRLPASPPLVGIGPWVGAKKKGSVKPCLHVHALRPCSQRDVRSLNVSSQSTSCKKR